MNDFDTFWHEAKAALRVALQWFFLAVPMGLLCGFLGTLFHLAVEHATELRAAQPWLLFLLPVAGLLINALYKVTKCEGVGTNNVIRAVQSGEPVSILLVPAIFLGTVLTHLCGGSAGREGAALQMGGSIGWNLGTLLRLKDHDRRTATISGMAAFFSALFGTPLAAACFAMMVEDVGLTFTAAFVPAFTSALIAQPWLLFLLPVAGLLINALYKVTKCEGVGTNNVIRAVQSGEPVSILLVPAIFLGTVLTHLCGGSAGREGAALQMGGSIGWNLGTLLRLKDHDRRTATISGMAAFFSALFGTPLAAACFAMMVEDVGLTFTAAFVPAFTSALIAYGCSLAFGIAPTHFALTAPELNVRTALLVILLGVACAAVSRLFCYTLHFMEHTVPKLLPNPWVRVFAGGVLVVGFSYLFGVGRYNGAGMGVIVAAVEQGQALPWDFLCKIFLTALTLACGFKGGEVVPSFFVGATFGCVVGPLLGLPAEFAAAVGLVSIFCGATNVLIPSILLGFELFSGAGLELIALGCGICFMLSGHHGLYSSQTFVTNKLRSEYMSHKWRVKVKKAEE